MYGAIFGSEWGEQSDNFRSDKFHDDTLEYLEKTARENNPILQRIRRREWDVERLAKDYPAREENILEDDRSPFNRTLENMLKKAVEENEADSEYAQKLRAAMNWQENFDEIEKLREELWAAKKVKADSKWWKNDEEKGLYHQNRQKVFETENSLEWAIKKTIASDEFGNWYEDWDKDYDFREEYETFLSNITSARKHFREELFLNQETPELVQKYLENPLWHLPQITNFLLVDLIDSDLIMLERDFYFGLFVPYIANEIEGLHSTYMPSLAPFHNITPCLAPKAKKARIKRRLKQFWIGVGLIYILRGSWEGKMITDLLINEGVPSWIFSVIWPIAGYLILLPIMNIVLEYINKRKIKYNSIYNQALNLLNIRWDIYSGTYDAKTCIERLKKLDDQDLHISSLVYPLLELQPKFRESLPQNR